MSVSLIDRMNVVARCKVERWDVESKSICLVPAGRVRSTIHVKQTLKAWCGVISHYALYFEAIVLWRPMFNLEKLLSRWHRDDRFSLLRRDIDGSSNKPS